MSTSETKSLVKSEKDIFLPVYLTLLKLVLFGILILSLAKPTGSLAGRIALEKTDFHLFSYDIRQNKVYAVAQGPRGDQTIERGVWVTPDGSFRIDHLPVGEYTLKAHAPGYSTEHESGIFVDEGKTTALPKTIAMNVLQPSVTVASNTRVFTTAELPHFWLNASGGMHAKVKLYRKDFLSLLTERDWGDNGLDLSAELQFYRSGAEVVNFIAAGAPVATLSRELSLDDNDSARADFKLTKPLAPGDYFAVAELTNMEGKVDRNFMWFAVTDIGLVIKQAPDRTLVRAVDLRSLHAKQGVKVSMYLVSQSAVGKPMATGVTAVDGFVSLPSPQGDESRNLMVVGTIGNQHAYGAAWYFSNRADSYQTYFYTDRPVYRLGQTVCYKAIIRKSVAAGYKTPKTGLTVQAVVEDPDNNKLTEQHLRTNDHGTVNGTINIPDEGKTGAYQVTFTYPDGSKAYERFEVSQYRKPEYQVEVLPAQPRVVAGAKVTAHVHATYYFGGPVRNARVKYSVYSSTDWSSRYRLMARPSYYGYFDDWGEEDGGSSYYYDSYGNNFVTEGYAQTDDNGVATITFDSQPIEPDTSHPFGAQYLDKRYKIEAEVTDLSRMSVISSGYATVTAGNFAVFVQPTSSVVKSGQRLSIDFNAVDYDRKPVANQKVTVRLVRWPWDAAAHSYRAREIEKEYTIATDERGGGHLSFPTKGALPTDTYYVTAQAVDQSGHIVYDESSLWIANQSAPYMLAGEDAHQEPLTVRLDKSIYKPGETAKVMVSGPFTGTEGAEAIVSIEGSHIFNYRTVPMTSTAQLVEVPIKAECEPDVFVSVAVVAPDRQFYTQSKMIKVSPAEHFLTITVETDKTKYKPGDSVKYTIHATSANGKPAPNTEVSLGVVDESIYAIRAETAENIQKFFYSRKYNSVNTLCSFPEQYSGGPDKIEPRVRKDFRDTAAWVPALTTNSDGVATATIKLPDNLTTWRATVRGIDLAVNVGAAISKIVSTQDLILRLALPRFFTEGDVGVISAVVHNYTDKTQKVKVTLESPPQFEVSKPLVQDRGIAPEAAERIEWPIKVVGSGQSTIFCKAVGQTAGDAIERKIPVRPLGLPAFAAKSGVLSLDSSEAVLPVGLSRDAVPATAKYQLSLAASSIGPVLGNFSKLIDYPYGCTEQTMSRLMPSVVAIRLNQALGVPLDKGMSEKFKKVYDLSVKKLDDYQHSDGGWGWWENDSSNIYLTAHVLEGYYLLRQCGREVDKSRTNKALNWLSRSLPAVFKQLNDPKLLRNDYSEQEIYIDIAKAVHVMSLYGQHPATAMVKQLQAVNRKLTPEALSCLTRACLQSGDSTNANLFYKRLISLAYVNDNMMDWDHRESLLKRFSARSASGEFVPYSYRFTGVETTALALEAVLAAEPGASDKIEAIKNWILLNRDRDGWGNTKTTAEVFVALLNEELKARSHGKPDFSLVATLAGTALTNLTFGERSAYAPEETLAVPVPSSPAELLLKKTGPGRLYYSSLLTYMRHLLPGDQAVEKSMPQGVHLERQFFRLKPNAVKSDGSIHYNTEAITDHVIHAGETVLMKVNVEAPVRLPYVILEAALPSGAEVVEDDSRKEMVESSSSGASGITGDWGDLWWTHQDILDDRIVFFVTSLPAGKHEFWTLVRLEMPGTFQINPMSVEGMYTKRVRAYSPLDYLKVVE